MGNYNLIWSGLMYCSYLVATLECHGWAVLDWACVFSSSLYSLLDRCWVCDRISYQRFGWLTSIVSWSTPLVSTNETSFMEALNLKWPEGGFTFYVMLFMINFFQLQQMGIESTLQIVLKVILGSSMTNCDPVHSQSVTFKRCSWQLIDGDWTTFVPAECFSVSYLYCSINVYIIMDI